MGKQASLRGPRRAYQDVNKTRLGGLGEDVLEKGEGGRSGRKEWAGRSPEPCAAWRAASI